MTNDLKRRMKEHRESRGDKRKFAGKHYCHKLVYYEIFETPNEAIDREREIKNMSREEKFKLI